MDRRISVREVGPRDGLQMAASRMATPTKLRWIAAIAAAGVAEIEVGSFVPPRVIPQMADTDEVLRGSLGLAGVTVVALVPNLRGAQAAHAAGAEKITIPVSVSEGHSQANINRTPSEQVAEVARIVAWARAQARPMHIEAACSTAFGCSIDGTVPLASVLWVAGGLAGAGGGHDRPGRHGGLRNPGQIRATVRAVRDAVGPKLERLHLHDHDGPGPGQRAGRAGRGDHGVRRLHRRAGRLPLRARRLRQHRDRGSGFLLESMGHATGIDFDRLLAARAILAEALPAETLHGQLARAGLPKTFRRAA